MAQTINELEKERAGLLKAIESQAQQMSTGRAGQFADSSEHTLNDWLNAAEDVMPSKPSPKPQKKTTTPKATMASKSSFFGVIIMLSLLLTILGVIYIAYTSINNELKQVLELKETTSAEIKSLQESIHKLEETVASKGQGKLFKALQTKVDKLEMEVQQLKLAKVHSMSTVGLVIPSNTVTPAMLDQKLKEYTKGIDAKLEVILNRLNNDQVISLTEPAKKLDKKVALKEEVYVVVPEVVEPKEPTIKPLDQPVFRLVEKVAKPENPTMGKDIHVPLANYSADVKWLMEQPAFNYTLQLASMSEQSSIRKMIADKSLQGTKVVPQQRGDEVSYVLISGSYANRKEANNASAQYKANFGITPWVRKIKDLSAKVK